MKNTFRNLSDNFLSVEQMRKINGGFLQEGCVNTCSGSCPCSDSADWCDGGLCKTRPIRQA